jgi:hypothetical protein
VQIERSMHFTVQPRSFEAIRIGARVVYDTAVDGDASTAQINSIVQETLDLIVQADLEEAARVVSEDVTSFVSYWHYDEEE